MILLDINFLHLAYLKKNKCTLSIDLDKYVSNMSIFTVNNDLNELKIKNNLNMDSLKNKIESEFKNETGVSLNENSYFIFIKDYYLETFNKDYSNVVAKLFKEADANSKGFSVPVEKKKGFFAKLFKPKESPVNLDKNKYNASIFNETIESKLENTDNKYFKEVLELNKFIIFKKEKFPEVRELFKSPELLNEYILIKDFIKTKDFEELSEQMKIDKIRELFKNIINQVEKLN